MHFFAPPHKPPLAKKSLFLFGHLFFNTSWPPQEKLFIWSPFFQYNKRLLGQKMGGACLYMPQDSHWLASFEVIPPPKVSFFAPKNRCNIFNLIRDAPCAPTFDF